MTHSMFPWEVTCGDSGSGLLTRRLVTAADVELWAVRLADAVAVAAPPDYAAEIAGVLERAGVQVRCDPQHGARDLASYVPARSAARWIRAKYRRADQAERGLRRLVASRKFLGWRGVFLIDVLPGVADDLLRRADKDMVGAPQTADRDGDREYRRLADRHVGPIPIPESLAAAFAGASPAVHAVRRAIVVAARIVRPVLVLGEMGTGKELAAREIHRLSSRSAGPFIVVNCAALDSSWAEMALVGRSRGGMPGAPGAADGLFAAADGGTLFLDEIGDLPVASQARVERLLDGGVYQPVGASRERRVNARVIASSGKDLLRLVRQQRFRQDLYFRLQSFRIQTPALRDRAEDIPDLARLFWRRICDPFEVPLPLAALPLLRDYAWNGNARELRSFLEELEANTIGRAPTPELLRSALAAWKGRAEPRDYSWARPAGAEDR